MSQQQVIVNDLMQKEYSYILTEPCGANFSPNFAPDLTPPQLLELGVFGGKYMTDCREEFPSFWFKKAKLCSEFYDEKLNFFGVRASQPLSIWQKKGWIHPEDPRGWFQWYARYYMGRRGPDDERQIKRWRAIKRHITQIQNNCQKGDNTCRIRQRQAVLHWAYDARKM